MDELEIVANLVRIAEEEGVFGIEVTVQGDAGSAKDCRRYSIRLGSSAAPVDLEEAEDEAHLADEVVPAAPSPPAEHIISSPLVGMFHRSSEPGSAPLVEVGQMVHEGQPLCCVESLKVFREITSDVAGRIAEIMVRDEEPVDYGRPLVRIICAEDGEDQG